MQTGNVIRAALFVLFFSIGAAALSAAILCDDLIQYYRNRELLNAAQESLDQLKLLNNDYDALLSQLENDPNLVKRITRVTLATESEDPNTVYPKATEELLAAARRVLAEDPNRQSVDSVMPAWLSRCGEPRRRMMLLFFGVALILTSFICFGPAKRTPEKQE
jgi:hypothetical protein